MDSQPLTQQSRPDSFEPKITQLYLYLFNVLANNDADDIVPLEGFWRELFLLKPDKQRLHDILEPMTADDLVHLQTVTQMFFKRAISEAGSGIEPRNENALENLTAFLCAVFNKRYSNPNTDIIDVLAGLDAIDQTMSDLVGTLESIIRQSSQDSFRAKAAEVVLALVSGGFQTSLVTYFMHRDLFPALMKFFHDSHKDPLFGLQTFVLVGVLSSYNKFEAQNVYLNRIEDFVNEETIQLLVRDVKHSCTVIRDEYVAVQDDYPVPWSLNSTLTMVGLRSLSSDANKPTPPTEEEAKARFNSLPSYHAACVLPMYTFVQANNLFATDLLSLPAEKDKEAPFASFLSMTSYVAHHAYRGPRQSTYAILCLLSVRIMVEDHVLGKKLCSSDFKGVFRLCRQRVPHLPLVTSTRTAAAAILDVCTDVLSHNLRKRLDVNLYSLTLSLILRIVTLLDQTKTRLQHHWQYVWGSLISLIRFLTQYADDLKYLRDIRDGLCATLSSLAAFCLSKGDGFLPDPASFDDFFYKLIEAHDVLLKFQQAYCDAEPQSSRLSRSVRALVSVSAHYHDLLKAQHGKKIHQSPAAIQKVIKDGYETLNMDSNGEVGHWEKWREISWKPEMKRMIRVVVEDARSLSLR